MKIMRLPVSTQQSYQDANALEILPEDVPVTMPDLPLKLVINTPEQFKAFGDPLRERILAIVQYQPATAKQIADRLKVPPGTVGHHLQVLEAAGLVQIVARRLVRGVVAKYYTRTARIFCFEMSREVTGNQSVALQMLTQVRDELADAIATNDEREIMTAAPRARISRERLETYLQKVDELTEAFLSEPADPNGEIYTLSVALFKAPAYVQNKE
jgi:DNA-binding transcriptional ArsR family regulator